VRRKNRLAAAPDRLIMTAMKPDAMRRVFRIACGLLALLAAAASARPAMEAGWCSGVAMAEDVEQNNPIWGLQAELALTDALAIELGVARLQDIDVEERLDARMRAQIGILPISLTLRAKLPAWGFGVRPYLLAGCAWHHYEAVNDIRVKGSARVPETLSWTHAKGRIQDTLGGHAGAGVEWHPSPRWRLFVDYRWGYVEPNATVSGMPAATPEAAYVRNAFRHDLADKYWIGFLRLGLNRCF